AARRRRAVVAWSNPPMDVDGWWARQTLGSTRNPCQGFRIDSVAGPRCPSRGRWAIVTRHNLAYSCRQYSSRRATERGPIALRLPGRPAGDGGAWSGARAWPCAVDRRRATGDEDAAYWCPATWLA